MCKLFKDWAEELSSADQLKLAMVLRDNGYNYNGLKQNKIVRFLKQVIIVDELLSEDEIENLSSEEFMEIMIGYIKTVNLANFVSMNDKTAETITYDWPIYILDAVEVISKNHSDVFVKEYWSGIYKRLSKEV
jgi:hypothetical protein